MRSAGPISGARLAMLLGGLALLVLLIAVGSLFIGSARVPPGDVMAVLAGRVKGVDQVVVLSLRLPRILVALLAAGRWRWQVPASRHSRATRSPSPPSWASRAAPLSAWSWPR